MFCLVCVCVYILDSVSFPAYSLVLTSSLLSSLPHTYLMVSSWDHNGYWRPNPGWQHTMQMATHFTISLDSVFTIPDILDCLLISSRKKYLLESWLALIYSTEIFEISNILKIIFFMLIAVFRHFYIHILY